MDTQQAANLAIDTQRPWDAGMSMTVDRMGTMFARRPGRRAGLAAVMAGSHLDTQPTGGKSDGVQGVLAALAWARIFSVRPVHVDETGVAAVREGAEAHGSSHREIRSGAGHDAIYIAANAPTAMVSVPWVGGVSHNQTEGCKPEWVTAGANVLLHAVLEMAARID